MCARSRWAYRCWTAATAARRLLPQDIRQDNALGEGPGARGRGDRGRIRHTHRQQAHLRHAHSARRRGLGGGGLRALCKALDRAREATGVDFIGGFSALVQKGMTPADEKLIRSIPEALAETELVCSSVNIGSTRAGINMDAVALMGEDGEAHGGADGGAGRLRLRKLVVFCNAVEDNPFMAGALPRRERAGHGDKRRRLRPRRGASRAARRAAARTSAWWRRR